MIFYLNLNIFILSDEKFKLKSKDQLLFINGFYFDTTGFKDAYFLLKNLDNNNNNNDVGQVDFLIARNLNKKTTCKYSNKSYKNSKYNLLSDSLISLKSFSSSNLSSSSLSTLSIPSIFNSDSVSLTTAKLTKSKTASFTSNSISSSIYLYNLNDDSLLHCSIQSQKHRKQFKKRFFQKYFNSDYSSNETLQNISFKKKESNLEVFESEFPKSQMTLKDAMVLNTEWTQIETIELLNEISSFGNNLSGTTVPTGAGGAGLVSGGSGGFGFGITGNKSTGVVVKALTIGGSAHKVNFKNKNLEKKNRFNKNE